MNSFIYLLCLVSQQCTDRAKMWHCILKKAIFEELQISQCLSPSSSYSCPKYPPYRLELSSSRLPFSDLIYQLQAAWHYWLSLILMMTVMLPYHIPSTMVKIQAAISSERGKIIQSVYRKESLYNRALMW